MTTIKVFVGEKAVDLPVAYWADYPCDERGRCALCHGDPCAERSPPDSPISEYYRENTWAVTCPVCDGRPS